MAHWGQSINTVSSITLIMSVGFSVDFIAHVAFEVARVSKQPLTKGGFKEGNARLHSVIEGVRNVAEPVLQAGLSTFIAIIPNAFAESQIFFNFFSITFLIILFGMLHGLVWLPAMFALIGPKKKGFH